MELLDRLCPLDFAASTAMGVGARQGQVVRAELLRYGSSTLTWFRTKALELISSGKIPDGANTDPCSLADAFYLALGGSHEGAKWLEHSGDLQVLNGLVTYESIRSKHYSELDVHEASYVQFIMYSAHSQLYVKLDGQDEDLS